MKYCTPEFLFRSVSSSTEKIQYAKVQPVRKPAKAHDVTKRSAEVEFYIRATKPARTKLGRCQSGTR